MFWLIAILALLSLNFFEKNFSNWEYYSLVEIFLYAFWGTLAVIFIKDKKIKSFSKTKNIKSFQIYTTSNYKNRNFIQTFNEMHKVYLEEFKKTKNKNKASKKAIRILIRDIFEWTLFFLYMMIGVAIVMAILIIVLKFF